MMKRSYADITTTLLPVMGPGDPRIFKSILDGSYRLRVVKATDISKPTAKPIDEIDEPEEEEIARENRLNQTNARMLQLNLKDTNNTDINAIEMERIEKLTQVKSNWFVVIEGPVEVRCGNMLLESKHVSFVEPSTQQDEIVLESRQENDQTPPNSEDVEIVESMPGPSITFARPPPSSQQPRQSPALVPPVPQILQVDDEEWDDWSDEGEKDGGPNGGDNDDDDDDCIIIE